MSLIILKSAWSVLAWPKYIWRRTSQHAALWHQLRQAMSFKLMQSLTWQLIMQTVNFIKPIFCPLQQQIGVWLNVRKLPHVRHLKVFVYSRKFINFKYFFCLNTAVAKWLKSRIMPLGHGVKSLFACYILFIWLCPQRYKPWDRLWQHGTFAADLNESRICPYLNN